MFKLYLDDERPTPEGWVGFKWPKDLIVFYVSNQNDIDIVSLDHDLGSDETTGYDVLIWIESQIHLNKNFALPRSILIHTANSSARLKMKSAVDQIYKKAKELGVPVNADIEDV